MPDVRLAEISEAPIDHSALVDAVRRPDAGAISVFLGTVRDNDPQATGTVTSLSYTCHPSAPSRFGEIVAAVLAEHDPEDGCAVAAVHRIGHLTVGEAAFVVAVSSGHRALAMAVCEQVVEHVKAELPIWKQQFEADGSYRWSGL